MAIRLFDPDVAWCAGSVCAQVRSGLIGPGTAVKVFEELLCEKVGVKHAVCTTSGTAALMLSLWALELPEKSTVLFPAYGMLAGANAARMLGHGVRLRDCDERGLIQSAFAKAQCTIPIDHNGARQGFLATTEHFIEDACQALGCIHGIKAPLACLSFSPQKLVTSVPGNEFVILMDPEGQLRMRQIGEFVDEGQFHGWRAASFDANHKAIFSEIYGVTKHPSCEPLFEITLENGRQVSVSASHSMFILNSFGRVQTISTKDLRVGDFCVAPQRIPSVRLQYQTIDIFGYLKRARPEYSLTSSTEGSVTGQGRRTMRLKDAERSNITHASTVGWRSFQLSPALTVDEDLAYFIGWFVAEGSCGTSSAFSMHKRERNYAERLLEIAAKHFGCRGKIYHKGENGISVHFGGRWVGNVLADAIGVGRGAANKRVPDSIFNSPDSVIDSFLEGYFLGDGHESRRDRGVHDTRAKTVSRELVHGLQLLMLIRGVHFTTGKAPEGVRHFKTYTSFTKETFHIRTTKANGRNVRSNVIPKNALFDFSLRGKRGASKEYILERARSPELRALANGDMSYLKVTRIREIKSPEFVYDLSVRETENFFGGCGFIALHNTGQGGAILTNDRELAKRVRWLIDHGGDWREDRIYKRIGGNFRFNDVLASLGLPQLRKLEHLVERRMLVRSWYRERLPQISPDDGWLVMFPSRDAAGLVKRLKSRDIEASQLYPPVHWSAPYRTEENFPGAEAFHHRHVYLPSHLRLCRGDVETVSIEIERFENEKVA